MAFTATYTVTLSASDKDHARGEYVLVVQGAAEASSAGTIEEALEQVKALVDKGMRGANACKQVAAATGFSKGELYNMLLDINTV